MKKNLFEIKTEEVQRILSLHEERSKTQYLNIISEQDSQKYTVQSKEYFLTNNTIGGNRLKLFKNATFTKKGNTVISKTNVQFVDIMGNVMSRPDSGQSTDQIFKGINVTYYCSGTNAGKFNTDNFPSTLFYDEKKVFVEMKGSCAGCPSSTATLKGGIENLLKAKLPSVVEEVISV